MVQLEHLHYANVKVNQKKKKKEKHLMYVPQFHS